MSEKKKAKKIWEKLFGFHIGDRVKFKVYGRKSPFYGDIVKIDHFHGGNYLIYVKIDGDIVWCERKELEKIQRRKRKCN